MKRIILIVLSIAVAGTIAITHAHEDSHIPDCDHCETVDGECCCGGTTDGCMEDCDSCEECDCGGECDDCTDCDGTDSGCKDCTGSDCGCHDSISDEDEEEVHHCDGCHQ